MLADVVAEQTRSLDRLAVNAADTYARLGGISLTRLRYAEAAKHFANAAAVFPRTAVTRTSGSAISQGRQVPSIGKEMSSGITVLCFRQSSAANA